MTTVGNDGADELLVITGGNDGAGEIFVIIVENEMVEPGSLFVTKSFPGR